MALLASPENVDGLAKTMQALHAEVIEVPPLHIEYLRKGHAIHFRCRHPEVKEVIFKIFLADIATICFE